ncbi:MFS transporter [Streptomyces sp. enrichment culture]|uniref:MFS transporter n=1 Tax=Streptomyces sp. enrichment culture TaxID=1795815 RepID=UPI003F57A8BD
MPPFEEETPTRDQKTPTRAPEAPVPPESAGSPAPEASGGPGVSRHGRTLLLVAVSLGFVIALLSSSIKNTVTAFYVSMTEDFDVSRGTFAIAPSAFMLTYAIASPVMGFVADRFGARKSLAGGLVLGGVLFLAGGLTHSFAVFTLVYGVGLAISYTAVSYVPLGVLVDELFPPHRRGVTYAILMNGTAVGFVALLPLWIHLDEGTVWRSVFQWLGVILLVVTVAALLILPKEPSAAAGGGGAAPARKSSAGMLSEVLGSRVFWTVSLAFFGCGVTMAFVDVHLVAHLDHIGLGGSVAGTTVALLGAAEIVGALIAGYYCDRGHGLKVLAGSYLVRSLSLVVLMAAPTALAANVFGLLFGITYLGTVVASSMYLINSLDARAKGLALGLMWFIHQIGAFVASEGGGISYDTLQSYDPVVVGSAVIALVSTVIVAVWLPKALRAAGTGAGGDGTPAPGASGAGASGAGAAGGGASGGGASGGAKDGAAPEAAADR